MNKRADGNAGEQAACDYLSAKGWRIIGRNVRMGRNEIDIIAGKKRTIAFIEVKRRSSTMYGQPAEAVNAEKQRRIIQAAALFAESNGLENAELRFDVIEVLPGEIRHIEGAFDATGIF